MIVVTGGAGFIGSNIIKTLNQKGCDDIIVVDDLSDGHKFVNIVNCKIADYLDKNDFLEKIKAGQYKNVKAIIHQGACSTTTEWNGQYMMENNYEYSKTLLHHALEHQIPFLYASSAATYGMTKTFIESPEYEGPLNVYGYSKLLFDNYLRRLKGQYSSQVAGFRYFNVYGPHEQHKGSMASVAFHLNTQLLKGDEIKLFGEYDGYQAGEQRRDFIYIDDVVSVVLWFLENPDKSGIFNLGTGRSSTFNEVANAVLKWHGRGKLTYIPFPDHLKNAYQSYTEANMRLLNEAGYDKSFHTVEEGVAKYLDWLNKK